LTVVAEKALYAPTVSPEELEHAREAFKGLRTTYVEAPL
jgi:hypothetical protein